MGKILFLYTVKIIYSERRNNGLFWIIKVYFECFQLRQDKEVQISWKNKQKAEKILKKPWKNWKNPKKPTFQWVFSSGFFRVFLGGFFRVGFFQTNPAENRYSNNLIPWHAQTRVIVRRLGMSLTVSRTIVPWAPLSFLMRIFNWKKPT